MSAPGYMPGGATPPVKSLSATMPASASCRDLVGVLARVAAEQRVVDVAFDRTCASFSCRRCTVSVAGLSSGMSTTVVMPPFAAARVAPW